MPASIDLLGESLTSAARYSAICSGLSDKPSPLISYLPFLKNSVAAQSSASTTSLPSLKPAWSTAAAMKSSAARVEARFGAKPPSSPTAGARTLADRPLDAQRRGGGKGE